MATFQTAFGKHRVVDLFCPEESLTLQSCQDECDINSILSKWQKTGIIEHANVHQGQYGEFINVTDYHDAMNQVIAADSMFASLPSSIRDKFNNSPYDFLAFAENPDNHDAMIDLGLISKPEGFSLTIPQESNQNTEA